MSRGQGRVYRPKVRGEQTAVWWLDYSVRGKRHRESAGTTSKRDAQDVLRERIDGRKKGKLTGNPDRVTFAQLRELAERQYRLDGRRSLDRLEDAFDHLERFFGKEATVPEITTDRLDDYAEHRMGTPAAKRKDRKAPKAPRPGSRATVNYELAALRRGFKLACKKGILGAMPVFELPKVRNARSGFFEAGDLAALVLELPGYLQSVIRFLHLTGWRRGEALSLTWDQVDWEGQTVRLSGTQTKADEPRVFPFGLAPELKELLEAQWKARDGLFVFHRGGRKIGNEAVRKNWLRACQRAGLAGRLVHDLRRTAARDMRRAGLAESDIMELCGWETREMFKRYCIRDEDALAHAVARRFANGKQPANIPPAEHSGESLSSDATT